VGSHKVLELSGLSKWFPVEGGGDEAVILAGIDLLIMRGERVGLVGPNGAGKSLLFRLILEQEAPSEGEIRLGPSVRSGITPSSTRRCSTSAPSSIRCGWRAICPRRTRWLF
jgi:ATPase subunit of ABC transporter with duplicated ATPase domains